MAPNNISKLLLERIVVKFETSYLVKTMTCLYVIACFHSITLNHVLTGLIALIRDRCEP